MYYVKHEGKYILFPSENGFINSFILANLKITHLTLSDANGSVKVLMFGVVKVL